MAGYRPTQIRKPSDETEFEKNCVVLFKELLDDPNVSRVGTRGQGQNGVDIKGNRNCDPHQVVGIQCKLKAGRSKLTKKEVDDEVKEALQFTPELAEYFIVTNAKNDTRLTQQALQLMQEQAKAGRHIQIEVWGWDTLEEKINLYDAAKNAFDPGFSPALAKHERKLDAMIDGQAQLATKADLAALRKQLGPDGPHVHVQLPRPIADRELRDAFAKALHRRGFSGSDPRAELADLANRAIDGDLALGTPALRAEICERAARANSMVETSDTALRFRNHALALDPARDLFVVDAFLREAGGDTDGALRDLKARTDTDARSALFMVLLRQGNVETALAWARTEGLRSADFTPPTALNLILRTIENGEFDNAFDLVAEVPAAYVGEIPVLLLLRAQLTVAALLPIDQKAALFQGLPVNPRLLQLASGTNSQAQLKSALADIETLMARIDELGIDHLKDYFSEYALWLRLEIADFNVAVRAQLAAEVLEPATTLRRVRLALAYGVPFDRDALQRTLARRKELGGWTSDERFAAFLIALQAGDYRVLCAFFDDHRDDLYTRSDLSPGYLASVEIEALTRSGRVDEARQRLAEYHGKHLTDEQVKDAEEAIVAITNGDEVELYRQRYDAEGGLLDLRLLVGELRARNDIALLATYAPALARATMVRADFDIAVKSLYQTHRDAEAVGLLNDLSEVAALDIEYESIRGWALYRLGRVVEARVVARRLLGTRGDANDRELVVNTAIETGDWSAPLRADRSA